MFKRPTSCFTTSRSPWFRPLTFHAPFHVLCSILTFLSPLGTAATRHPFGFALFASLATMFGVLVLSSAPITECFPIWESHLSALETWPVWLRNWIVFYWISLKFKFKQPPVGSRDSYMSSNSHKTAGVTPENGWCIAWSVGVSVVQLCGWICSRQDVRSGWLAVTISSSLGNREMEWYTCVHI